MAAFNGENVLFLQGTQNKLNDLMANGGAKKGAFYLTNDTHRLYIGQEITSGTIKPVPVNEGVVTVNTIDDLPTTGVNAGEFYYVSSSNILCVYNGSTFIQINSDTDTDSFIKEINNTEVTSDADGIKVSFDIVQKAINKQGEDITAAKESSSIEFKDTHTVEFTISKTHLNTVLPDNINVGLDVNSADNGVALSTIGSGSDTTAIINLKQGDNVNIELSDNNITLNAENTTYDLVNIENSDKGQIQLQAKDGSENDNIYFESGNDALTVASNNAGVTYTHKEYVTTPGDLVEKDVVLDGNDSFEIIDGITVDKGHVTGYSRKTIKLPKDENTTNISMTIDTDSNALNANAEGSLVVTITDSASNTVSARADDVLYNTITVDGTEKTIYNQQDLGAFYSANKIDEIISGVNAMTYKGTVDSTKALPTTDVKVGDTYKVAEDGVYNIHECNIGDLLIATGIEVDGIIVSDLVWTYIPSGDDTDTHYDIEVRVIADVDGAEIILGNDVNNDEDKVQILGGTTIDITPNTVNSTITVNHENVVRNDGEKLADENPSSDGEGRVTVVDSVETNSQGHVTAVKVKDIVIPKDENTKYDISVVADHKINLHGTDNSNDFVQLDTDKNSSGVDYIVLTDDVNNNKIYIDHKEYEATTLSAIAGTASELASGTGTFTAITGIVRDSGGHITGVTSNTWQLPIDNNTTYDLNGHDTTQKTVDKAVTISTTLNGSDTSENIASFDLTSDTLKLTAGTNSVAVELVWGSF